MKINKIYKTVFLVISISLMIVACSPNDYFDDGGLSKANIDVNKVEYLEKNSWQLFDTLVLLIDHNKMRDEVNNAATFFAVTDYAFEGVTLEQLYERYTKEALRDYIFKEKVRLEDLPLDSPKNLVSESGNLFQVFARADENYYSGTKWSSYEPKFLYLTKVIGEIDIDGVDPNGTVQNSQKDIDIICQTEGIIDPKGNILHVLANSHIARNFN